MPVKSIICRNIRLRRLLPELLTKVFSVSYRSGFGGILMKYHFLIVTSLIAGFAVAKSQELIKKENKELAQEYLMVRNHIKQKPQKAKIYIFDTDIKKKNYKKIGLEDKDYDLY